MKKLIVNADDFGLHPEVNKAILQGHRDGCLTSTSLMPTAGAAAEAAALAENEPSLGIGVHLTLVAEKPLLRPEQVPTLVDSQGRFFANHAIFIKKYLSGQISLAEIREEAAAQIRRVKDWGILPTHLDSHQHLHVLPGILDICLDLAREHAIRKMRIPAEPYLFSGGYPASPGRMAAKCGLTFLARLARRKARRQGLVMPDHFFGMVAGGHMEERYFQAIIKALPEGCSEIMVHPGLHTELLARQYDWQYQWADEYRAVTSPDVRRLIRENHVDLISFKELVHE